MSHMSDYLENKLIDHVFRGLPYTAPTTIYFALYTALPSDTGGGTEVTGGNYARVGVTASGANFANTQASGTGASTGTGGTTSNSGTVTFNAPSANWGSIVGMATFDSSTGGNELTWGPLAIAKTVNNGDPAPSFAVAGWSYQIDN